MNKKELHRDMWIFFQVSEQTRSHGQKIGQKWSDCSPSFLFPIMSNIVGAVGGFIDLTIDDDDDVIVPVQVVPVAPPQVVAVAALQPSRAGQRIRGTLIGRPVAQEQRRLGRHGRYYDPTIARKRIVIALLRANRLANDDLFGSMHGAVHVHIIFYYRASNPGGVEPASKSSKAESDVPLMVRDKALRESE